jgi:hypothetical protein
MKVVPMDSDLVKATLKMTKDSGDMQKQVEAIDSLEPLTKPEFSEFSCAKAVWTPPST